MYAAVAAMPLPELFGFEMLAVLRVHHFAADQALYELSGAERGALRRGAAHHTSGRPARCAVEGRRAVPEYSPCFAFSLPTIALLKLDYQLFEYPDQVVIFKGD
jgi:hypothetical protein